MSKRKLHSTCTQSLLKQHQSKGGFTIHANTLLCGRVSHNFYAGIHLNPILATALRPCRVNGCVYCEPALITDYTENIISLSIISLYQLFMHYLISTTFYNILQQFLHAWMISWLPDYTGRCWKNYLYTYVVRSMYKYIACMQRSAVWITHVMLSSYLAGRGVGVGMMGHTLVERDWAVLDDGVGSGVDITTLEELSATHDTTVQTKINLSTSIGSK